MDYANSILIATDNVNNYYSAGETDSFKKYKMDFFVLNFCVLFLVSNLKDIILYKKLI